MDLKKIVALTTLSQLELMMAILGLGYPELAFFHLITHAIFKALLLMCAGNYIHSLGDNQDIRWMVGGGDAHTPDFRVFYVVKHGFMWMPFLAGFYSKDAILETALVSPTNGGALGLNILFAKVIHDYRFWTIIEFFAPRKRIMDAKKYYLDLFKKTA